MILGIAFLLLAIIAWVLIRKKYFSLRERAFRAEVAVETLRICREHVAQYREQHPEETYSFSVVEETSYMALKGPRQLRRFVHRQALASVRSMKGYAYEEFQGQDRLIGYGQVFAHSPQDAARKVAGPQVIELGFGHQLRVRVANTATPDDPWNFYGP